MNSYSADIYEVIVLTALLRDSESGMVLGVCDRHGQNPARYFTESCGRHETGWHPIQR